MSPEPQLAQYTNHFRIGHNAHEFVIECCQQYEDGRDALVVSRLAMTPATANQLRQLLDNSLGQHQQLQNKQPAGQ